MSRFAQNLVALADCSEREGANVYSRDRWCGHRDSLREPILRHVAQQNCIVVVSGMARIARRWSASTRHTPARIGRLVHSYAVRIEEPRPSYLSLGWNM